MAKIEKEKLKRGDIEKFLAETPFGAKIKITFREDDLFDINYLIAMIDQGGVKVSQPTYGVLLAISESKEWGGDRNRTVEIELTPKFDSEWFVDKMAYRLEKMESV